MLLPTGGARAGGVGVLFGEAGALDVATVLGGGGGCMGPTSHRGGLRAAHPEVHKMPAKERYAAPRTWRTLPTRAWAHMAHM